MQRRLPIYLLLDCSESLGDHLHVVEESVSKMLSVLARNPYSMETAVLSLITFAAKAKVALPLTEVTAVKPPALSCRPGTSLGAALDLLRESIERDVVKTTAESKGDFKPMVFIITDGYPTDDWRRPLKRLRDAKLGMATVYAVGIGDEADFETLRQIADGCVRSKDLSAESLSKLFVWGSASIQTQSVAPEGKASLEKAPLGEGMELVDKESPPKFSGKDDTVYLHASCQKTLKLYLMVYKRSSGEKFFHCDRSVKLPEDFYSDGAMKSPPVDAGLLRWNSRCPYCGASSLVKCGGCGRLSCFDYEARPKDFVCSSCHRAGPIDYDHGFSSVDGSQG